MRWLMMLRGVSLLPLTAAAGASLSPENTRRRAPIPLSRRRSVRMAALAAAVAAVVAGMVGLWLWQSTLVIATVEQTSTKAATVAAEVGFTINTVLVSGRVHTERATILAELGIAEDTAILSFSPDAARHRLEKLPWVASVKVERRLPDTLVVALSERTPLAIWQRQGRYAVIDSQGAVVLEDDIGEFAELPLVVGEGAETHAAALLTMLKTQPELAHRVNAAVRVGNRRWDLQLDDKITVRLPADNLAEAWQRLASYEDHHHLLSRGIDLIDLRLSDRVMVRQLSDSKQPVSILRLDEQGT